MEWWMWALLGFGLLACEMLTPGAFYFAFFGVGAIVTSGLVVGRPRRAGVGRVAHLHRHLGRVPGAAPRPARALGDPREARAVDSLVGEELVLLDDVGPGPSRQG